MRVDVDKISSQSQIDSGMDLIVLEEPCHITNVRHKDKATHFRVQILDGIHELQHKAGHVAHRIRHITQDHDLRFFFFATIEHDMKRDPTLNILSWLLQRSPTV